jgi:HJR/Mrr/RecB family endonuclease
MLATPSTPAEQFENDYKLKHVSLRNIELFDVEKKLINRSDGVVIHNANLNLFGHCFEMTVGNIVLKATFDPTKIFKYHSELSDSRVATKYWALFNTPVSIKLISTSFFGGSKEVIIDPHEIITISFLMSSINIELLKEHYQKINEQVLTLWESFRFNVNLIVSKLLEDRELVEMGKNFIDEMPIGFYTNVDFLMLVDFTIELNESPLGGLSLLSSKEARELFINENSTFISNNSDDMLSYLDDKLHIFSIIINERISISDTRQTLFIAHEFIYNVVIEHLAQKWENDYKQYFQDIREISLDEAIERYCSIETVVHQDAISSGNFIYYLIKHGKFEQNNRNYLNCRDVFIPKLNQLMEVRKHVNFLNRLKTPNVSSQKKHSIDDVDLMTGQEFEMFIAELFSKMGYVSEITKASGDQGIDVIATKNGNKIGIQAKCYSSSVGNSAIQEVVAGKSHYRLDKAIVITNNFFTDAAQQLAQSNSIILWDRHILKEKIVEIFNSSMD